MEFGRHGEHTWNIKWKFVSNFIVWWMAPDNFLFFAIFFSISLINRFCGERSRRNPYWPQQKTSAANGKLSISLMDPALVDFTARFAPTLTAPRKKIRVYFFTPAAFANRKQPPHYVHRIRRQACAHFNYDTHRAREEGRERDGAPWVSI